VFAVIVGFLGSSVFRLSYKETLTPHVSPGDTAIVARPTEWSFDSQRYFRFSLIIAGISLAITVVEWLRMPKARSYDGSAQPRA
jgi:hypothetical protein